MSKRVRSARGEILDFELMKVKEKLSLSPASIEVKARETFIERKLKRRLKKAKRDMLSQATEENKKAEKEKEVKPEVETPEKEPVAKKRQIKKKDN